jgi:hypothetical protein
MTTGLLKTSPLEAMAQRKVEQKGPTSIMKFPANLGAHGTLMRFFEYSYGGTNGSEAIPLAEVLLPLPKQIQDNYKINVGGNELGVLGAGAAQLASDPNAINAIGKNLGKAAVDGAKGLAGATLSAFKGDTAKLSEALSTATDSALFLTRAGLGSVSPDLANGIGVGRGTAINPFATLVFSGVDLKVHSLEWLLSPESEKEARQLKKIIRTLQRMVLPKTGSPLGDTVTGATVLDRGIMRYPAMVDTYFQGIDQSYFFRFKTSMISQLSIDYTPNGIALNKGGKPSAIRITMTLNEAYIHTADDNSPSDILEEAITEKIDEAVTDNLIGDGEFPSYNPSQVRTPDGQPIASNNTASSDEVTVAKELPSGAIENRVSTKAALKAQGFSDAQIAGTTPTGISGVTFTPGA